MLELGQDHHAGVSVRVASSTTVAGNANDPAINAYAIKYTGGKPQKATGTPYKIGYVNQDSLVPGGDDRRQRRGRVRERRAQRRRRSPDPGRRLPGEHRGRRRELRRADGERPLDQARADRHAAQRQHRAVQRAERQEGRDHRQRRHARRLHHPAGEAFVAGSAGRARGHGEVQRRAVPPQDRGDPGQRQRRRQSRRRDHHEADLRQGRRHGEGRLRRQRGQRTRCHVGDVRHRRRQGRRLRVDPHAAELHQHVRRDQGARRHADRRHDRPVLRHADDRPPEGRRRHRRLPRRLVLRRLRLQLLPAVDHDPGWPSPA